MTGCGWFGNDEVQPGYYERHKLSGCFFMIARAPCKNFKRQVVS